MTPNIITEMNRVVYDVEKKITFDERKVPEIYHYTSPEGLDGILFNERVSPCFRFSRFDVLNDKSEGCDILDVYGRVVKQLFDEKKISKEFYEDVKEVSFNDRYVFAYNTGKTREIGTGREVDDILLDSKKGKVYLCCFSKNKDSLPMWNYYLKNETYLGYNIGIITSFFETEKNKSHKDGYLLDWFEVVYDEEEKEKILTELILGLFGVYINLKDEHDKKYVKDRVVSFVNKYRFIFKRECFRHEEEIRIILIIPDGKFEEAQEQKVFEVYYRNVKNYIVPYILYENIPKFSVQRITIGPMEDKTDIQKKRKEVLEEKMLSGDYHVGHAEQLLFSI